MYLSWIVEADGLAEARTSEERKKTIERIEHEIRSRAATTPGGSP